MMGDISIKQMFCFFGCEFICRGISEQDRFRITSLKSFTFLGGNVLGH